MRFPMSKLDLIKLYMELGWRLVAVRPFSKAAGSGWAEVCRGELKPWSLEVWRRTLNLDPDINIALCVGKASGVVVVDTDGPRVTKWVLELLDKAGIAPPMVRTSRGAHLYFEHEPVPSISFIPVELEEELQEREKKEEVEVKADGRLVMLPPSFVRFERDGELVEHLYVWERPPWETELPPLPEEIKAYIEGHVLSPELPHVSAWATPSPQKPTGKAPKPEKVRRALEEAGIRVVKEFEADGALCWRLSRCPACGKSEGYPWLILPWFRLKCFRETCPACRTRGGLSYRQWVKLIGEEHDAA